MHTCIRRFAAIGAVTAILGGGSVQAQTTEDDFDWTLHIDTARKAIVAVAEFDNGITLTSRCVDKAFDVTIGGLPEAPGLSRELRVSVGDDEPYVTAWSVGEPRSSAFSRVPARLAREMMRGGKLKIQVPGGRNQPTTSYVMELDPSSTAISRTLSACDVPLVDNRYDAFGDENTEGLSPGVEWDRAPRPNYPDPIDGRIPTRAFVTVSCILNPEGTLSQCIVESEHPGKFGFGQAVLDSMRRSRIRATDRTNPIGVPRTIIFQSNFLMN